MLASSPHPTLKLSEQGLQAVPDADLLRAYWVYAFVAKPWLVDMGSKVGAWSVNNLGPAKWAVKKTIFAQFCGGESVEACAGTSARLAQSGIHTILDYSVEGASDDATFDATVNELERTIYQAAQSKDIAFSVFKVSGIGRTEALEAASKYPQLALANPEAAQIAMRVDRLCRLAHSQNVRIFIDAEETWIQPFIDFLAIEAMKAYNQERPIVFNTYQLYLADGLARLQQQAEDVFAAGAQFGAKLVRGAYMEKEGAKAAANGWANPINPSKEATDALFDKAAQWCLQHIDKAAFCLGTHNAQSCQLMIDQMEAQSLPKDDARIWFAQLLGMSDNLSYPLAKAGYNVAKYVPYGPVKEVIPYLIRRAQENTTVAGQSGRELKLIQQEVARRKLNPMRFFF